MARRHLVTDGAAGMSVRGVARDIGIAPSALYRYFPSRDDLLTVLIRRTYVDIDALLDAATGRALAAHPADPPAAWASATLEYRGWALEHPEEFALVYGTPVPGYEAPEEATRQVGQQAGASLSRILLAAIGQGLVRQEFVAATQARMSPPMRKYMAGVARERGLAPTSGSGRQDDHLADLAPALFVLGIGAWSKLQGLVAMELFGHLPPVAPHAEEFFRLESSALVDRFVHPAPAPPP